MRYLFVCQSYNRKIVFYAFCIAFCALYFEESNFVKNFTGKRTEPKSKIFEPF